MTPPPNAAVRIARYTRRFNARRAVEAAAWRALRPFFALARPRPRNRAAREGRVLAVERTLRIGDTLVARPALAAIRNKYPDAELAVVCQPALARLCEADRLVDRVVVAEAGVSAFRRAAREAKEFGAARAYVLVPDRWSPYQAWLAGAREIIGYDYAGRGTALTDRRPTPSRANVPAFSYDAASPEIHAAAIWLRLLEPEAPAPSAYPPLEPGAAAREGAATFIRRAWGERPSPFVIMHPGAADRSYLWRRENWLEAGRELARSGVAALAVTGGPDEADAAAAVAAGIGSDVAASAAGLSLLETCALVAAADLVITLDTAPVHIASTMGTPVVALYGPGDEKMWAPLGVPYRAVVGDAPCRGCKTARCFQDRHYCMEAITPAAVVAAATELIEGERT
jgi:ADP-heptose:LPS heptosyltransferase